MMSRTKKLQVILSTKEYLRLKEYAEEQELSMSEVIRDYIKTLAPPKGGRSTSHA